jgi:hypothetical protein
MSPVSEKKGYWIWVGAGRPALADFSTDMSAAHRAEWIAARVAAVVDRSGRGSRTTGDVVDIWDSMELLYAEGKKRGHLP